MCWMLFWRRQSFYQGSDGPETSRKGRTHLDLRESFEMQGGDG